MRQIARLRDERRAIFRKKSYLLCVHDLPVAEFAKQFGITEIMPTLCNVYYKPMELSRAKFIAKFIRKEICEDGNIRRQMTDSLENKPFPPIGENLQKHTFFEFGSIEDHYKFREEVKESYPYAHYPVFEGYNHMQYQIKDQKGFAEMLVSVIDKNEIPRFSFLKEN